MRAFARKNALFAALFGAVAVAARVVSGCGLVEQSDSARASSSPDGGEDGAAPSPFDAAANRPDTSEPIGPPPVPCADAAVSGVACTPPAVCFADDRCCACGDGFCPQVWACAKPATNDPSCPATVPDLLSKCTVEAGVMCDYCAGSSPTRWSCTSARFFLECERTGNAECWYPGSLFGHCD